MTSARLTCRSMTSCYCSERPICTVAKFGQENMRWKHRFQLHFPLSPIIQHTNCCRNTARDKLVKRSAWNKMGNIAKMPLCDKSSLYMSLDSWCWLYPVCFKIFIRPTRPSESLISFRRAESYSYHSYHYWGWVHLMPARWPLWPGQQRIFTDVWKVRPSTSQNHFPWQLTPGCVLFKMFLGSAWKCYFRSMNMIKPSLHYASFWLHEQQLQRDLQSPAQDCGNLRHTHVTMLPSYAAHRHRTTWSGSSLFRSSTLSANDTANGGSSCLQQEIASNMLFFWYQ